MLLSGEGGTKKYFLLLAWEKHCRSTTVDVQKDGQNYLPIRANVFFVTFQKFAKTWILSIVYCNLRQMKIKSFLFKYLKGKNYIQRFFTFWKKLILLDKIFFLKIFKEKGLCLHLAQIAIKNMKNWKSKFLQILNSHEKYISSYGQIISITFSGSFQLSPLAAHPSYPHANSHRQILKIRPPPITLRLATSLSVSSHWHALCCFNFIANFDYFLVWEHGWQMFFWLC